MSFSLKAAIQVDQLMFVIVQEMLLADFLIGVTCCNPKKYGLPCDFEKKADYLVILHVTYPLSVSGKSRRDLDTFAAVFLLHLSSC